MSAWSFYDSETGLFTGRVKTLPGDALLKENTPPGCGALPGVFDRLAQRVDLKTGEVVAYQRPQAEIDAEQSAKRAREARAQIEQLERAQARPMRELAIDPDNAEAKRRLAEIDDEIKELRADVIRTPAEQEKSERIS